MAEVQRKLAPVSAEVRRRLGNFIIAEDDQTLEGVTLGALLAGNATLTIVENFTAGQITARIGHLPDAERVFRRGIVVRSLGELAETFALPDVSSTEGLSESAIETVARAARAATGATHALAVLIELDDGADRIDLGGTIWIGIATAERVETRRSRILGGREWVRLGAVELGLDCLRRFLLGLPVVERIDFERT
jgi:nicotinamide-nucleotide amidase